MLGGVEARVGRHRGLLLGDFSCHVLISRAAFASYADKVAPLFGGSKYYNQVGASSSLPKNRRKENICRLFG